MGPVRIPDFTLNLKISRPPLVLVHGLNSSPSTWQGNPLISDPTYLTTTPSYGSTSNASFAENEFAVQRGILEARIQAAAQGIAATKVDILAHSMGGLLTRIYLTSSRLRRPDNFFAGDVRRLITLNTPHRGSEIADCLIAIRDVLGPIPISQLVKGGGFDIDGGALRDLAVQSISRRRLGSTVAAGVPSHAIVGTGGSDTIELLGGGPLRSFERFGFQDAVLAGSVSRFGAQINAIYNFQPHDLAVSLDSQMGGLFLENVTMFGLLTPEPFPPSLTGGIHLTSTQDARVGHRVRQLLEFPMGQGPFEDGFPALPPSSPGNICGVNGPQSLPNKSPRVRAPSDVTEFERLREAAARGCGSVDSTKPLRRGSSVFSCDGRFRLAHQRDGNVVLYDTQDDRRVLFATGTAGRSTDILTVVPAPGTGQFGPPCRLTLRDPSGRELFGFTTTRSCSSHDASATIGLEMGTPGRLGFLLTTEGRIIVGQPAAFGPTSQVGSPLPTQAPRTAAMTCSSTAMCPLTDDCHERSCDGDRCTVVRKAVGSPCGMSGGSCTNTGLCQE